MLFSHLANHHTFQEKVMQSFSVNLALRNFVVGYYIVEDEQKGSDRATYGQKIIDNLAMKLPHIKEVSATALRAMRQFYIAYPQIAQTLSDELRLPHFSIQHTVCVESVSIKPNKHLRYFSYSHFIELIKIDDNLEELQ